MATKEKRGKKLIPRHPEKKWGPFAGGAGVAVWLNEFEVLHDASPHADQVAHLGMDSQPRNLGLFACDHAPAALTFRKDRERPSQPSEK
jgi:hypothetical protein